MNSLKINEKIIHYGCTNARELIIQRKGLQVISQKKEILKIDNYIIHKGDELIDNFQLDDTIFPIRFKINDWIINETHIRCYEEKINDSTIFLLPLLSFTKKQLLFDWLINAYCLYNNLKESYKVDKNSKLWLKYRFNSTNQFLEFEQQIKTYKNYIGKFDNIDKRFTTFVFKLDNLDIDKFFDGKYQEFSKFSISLIKEFHGYTKDSIEMKILNNDVQLRKKMCDELGCIIPSDISLRSKFSHYKYNETLQ